MRRIIDYAKPLCHYDAMEYVKHNPFSTRKTSPGRVPFLISAETFVFNSVYDQFREFNYRSQIIGGHGTGKSTFLADFIVLLKKNGHDINDIALHDRQHCLPRDFWKRQNEIVANFNAETSQTPPIMIVDGYEQLSAIQKFRLRRFAKKNRLGILITCHKKSRHFPVLFQTQPTFDILMRIVEHLFSDHPAAPPPDRTLCLSLFERHEGNIRNVLFDLYDHYEADVH